MWFLIKTKKKGISEVLVVQIATGFHWAVPDQDLWLGGHFACAVPIISVESATFHSSGMQDKSTYCALIFCNGRFHRF